MKKVFASDFDGTLYFYKAEESRKLPPENVAKVNEYQAAGHLFGLCTGRQVGGLTPFITGFVKPDFFITSSGANIIDGEGNPILKRGVDRSVADILVREMNPKGYRLTLDVEGDICVFAKMDYPGKYYVITGVDDAPKGLIHQVSIHTESLDDAAAVSAYVNERFGDKVEAFQNVIAPGIYERKARRLHPVRDRRFHQRPSAAQCVGRLLYLPVRAADLPGYGGQGRSDDRRCAARQYGG